MFTAPLYLPLALILFALHTSLARVTTISNDTPRYDVAGNIVPISDGNLLQHQGVFYLYGVKCVTSCSRIAAQNSRPKCNIFRMYQPCPVIQQATCYDPCGYYNNRQSAGISCKTPNPF
jgi:hypothetical protein